MDPLFNLKKISQIIYNSWNEINRSPKNLQTIQGMLIQFAKFRIENQDRIDFTTRSKKGRNTWNRAFPKKFTPRKIVHGINIPPPAHNHISATVFKLPLPLRIAIFGRDQLNRSTNPPLVIKGCPRLDATHFDGIIIERGRGGPVGRR